MVAPYIAGRLVEDTNDLSSLSLTPMGHVIAYPRICYCAVYREQRRDGGSCQPLVLWNSNIWILVGLPAASKAPRYQL